MHTKPTYPRLALVAMVLLVAGLLLGCGLWPSGDISDEASTTQTINEEDVTKTSGDDDTAKMEDLGDEILKIESLLAVYNGGTPPTFQIGDAHRITAIWTYHWNDGAGVEPGEISLEGEDGALYGPWSAVGKEGQGGVPNAYWWVYPDEVVPAGTYTVLDSDPGTWSQNEETGGLGVAWVYGFVTDE